MTCCCSLAGTTACDMGGLMEFYTQDRAASMQIGKNVYRRVSIPINDFNAACDHYGFVKERTCRNAEKASPDFWFICSECKHVTRYFESNLNYCPNCGARIIR